jgi:cell envelope opacity-associated protein A
LKKEGGMGQTNITQYVTQTTSKQKSKKTRITQTDTIFQFFKDNPSRSITYEDVGEWIKQEGEKNSVMEIKSYEKIMRSLAKDGKITKIDKGIFKYE